MLRFGLEFSFCIFHLLLYELFFFKKNGTINQRKNKQNFFLIQFFAKLYFAY